LIDDFFPFFVFPTLTRSSFLPLQTLRDYTRDYLFVKFSDTYYPPSSSSLPPPSHHPTAQSTLLPSLPSQSSTHQRAVSSSSLHTLPASSVPSSSPVALAPLGNGGGLATEKELRHSHPSSSLALGAPVGSIHQQPQQHSLAQHQQPLNRKHVDGSPPSPPPVVVHSNKRGSEGTSSTAGQSPLDEVVSVAVAASARLPSSSLGGAVSKSSTCHCRYVSIPIFSELTT
jgi:hypothetical protein